MEDRYDVYREMNLAVVTKVLKVEALCKANVDGLKIGEKYPVDEIHMGQSYTSVSLYGFRTSFNSIHFDFYVNGKKCNIYESVAFNGYLGLGEPFIKYE